MIFKEEARSLPISKEMVTSAYKKVKSKKGSAGADDVSLESFEEDKQKQLYKIWNRLSSGSYFPPPVKTVLIKKSNGKERKLGVPTVGDRVAQQVVKTHLEPRLEKLFHDSSYGYRPNRSAHQAIAKVQKHVRHYAWVLDIDIKSFFDEVNHELLLNWLDRHLIEGEKWVRMYVSRWLKAKVLELDGTEIENEIEGTPQGGVISPLLANLYLHYALDEWITEYIQLPFVRYADDVIIHCRSEQQAIKVLSLIRRRLKENSLRLNEEKTKIVYCQNYQRKHRKDKAKKFDFLGYSFKPHMVMMGGKLKLGYGCSISTASIKRIVESWKKDEFHRWTFTELSQIADKYNDKLRGIINYYGKHKRWILVKLYRAFDFRLAKWARNKYKRFKKSYPRAYAWLRTIKRDYPNLFHHWKYY